MHECLRPVQFKKNIYRQAGDIDKKEIYYRWLNFYCQNRIIYTSNTLILTEKILFKTQLSTRYRYVYIIDYNE